MSAPGAIPPKNSTTVSAFPGPSLPPSPGNALLNASGELRLADFSREVTTAQAGRVLIPVDGPDGIFKLSVKIIPVFPKQLAPLIEILQNTLPGVAQDLPCWFLWAYEVTQRFEKYAPTLAKKWIKEGLLVETKVHVEFAQKRPADFAPDVVSKLYDAKDGEKRGQEFEKTIQHIIGDLKERHPAEKSAEFLGLIVLLEHASAALSCNARVPFSLQKQPEKKVFYAHFLSFATFLDAIKSFKYTFAKSFPKYADTPSHQDKQQILEVLHRFSTQAINTFTGCIQRTMGNNRATVTGNSTQRAIIIDRVSRDNHSAFTLFKADCFLLIPLQKVVYSWMKHFWPAGQQENWDSLRMAISLTAHVITKQKDATAPLVLGALKDPALLFMGKQFHKLKPIYNTSLDALHPLLPFKNFENQLRLLATSPVFEDSAAEFFVEMLKKTVLNLGFHLQNLHQKRKELLLLLQGILQGQPKEALKANREKIIEAIRHFHQQSCLPIFVTFQLLFLIHRYNQFGEQSDESYVLSESAFLGEEQESEVFRPLSDYLHLTGLEKVFDRVLEEVVPLPHVEPKEAAFATLNAAVSQQYPKPQPEQIPPPPPVAKEDSKAPPKKPLVAKKQSAAAEAAKTQTAAAKSDSPKTPELDVLSLRTSLTDRRKLVAFLNSMGIVLAEGGNHSTATGLPPVPRHKTFSNGVRHKIIKELAEKALADGKTP